MEKNHSFEELRNQYILDTRKGLSASAKQINELAEHSEKRIVEIEDELKSLEKQKVGFLSGKEVTPVINSKLASRVSLFERQRSSTKEEANLVKFCAISSIIVSLKSDGIAQQIPRLIFELWSR